MAQRKQRHLPQKSLSMTPEIWARVVAHGAKEGLSGSAWIRRVVIAELDRIEGGVAA